MFEYRSDTRTGSNPVSATGNAMRRTLPGSAAIAEPAISSATRPPNDRHALRIRAPPILRKKRRNVPFPLAAMPKTKPPYWDDAARLLAERDPVLRTLIAAYPGLHRTRPADPSTPPAPPIAGKQTPGKPARPTWEGLVTLSAVPPPPPL